MALLTAVRNDRNKQIIEVVKVIINSKCQFTRLSNLMVMALFVKHHMSGFNVTRTLHIAMEEKDAEFET